MTNETSLLASRLALRWQEILSLLEPLIRRVEAADAKVYLLRRCATGPHVQLFKASESERTFDPYPLETERGLADWVMRNGRWFLLDEVDAPVGSDAIQSVCRGFDSTGQPQAIMARSSRLVKDTAPDNESTMFLMPLTRDAKSVGALSFWRNQGAAVFDRVQTPQALQDAASLISTAAALLVRDAVSARLVQVLADFHREADESESLPALFDAHAKAAATLTGAAATLLLLPDARGREQWIVGQWVDHSLWEQPLAFPPTCAAAEAATVLTTKADAQGLRLREWRALPATGERAHSGALAVFDAQSAMVDMATLDDGPIGDSLTLFLAQAGTKLIEHYVDRLRNACVSRLGEVTSDTSAMASASGSEARRRDAVDEALVILRRATGADEVVAYASAGDDFVGERQHDGTRPEPWVLERQTAPTLVGPATQAVKQGRPFNAARDAQERIAETETATPGLLVVAVCAPAQTVRVLRALALVNRRGPFSPMAEALALAVAEQAYRAEQRVKDSRRVDTLNELAQKWAGEKRVDFLSGVTEDLNAWAQDDVAQGARVYITANLNWSASLRVGPPSVDPPAAVPPALLAWSQADVEQHPGAQWRVAAGMRLRLPDGEPSAERIAYARLYLAQAGLRGHLFLALPSRAIESDWQAASDAARELALALERVRQEQRWRSQVGHFRHALRGPSQGLASAAKLVLRRARAGALEAAELQRLADRIDREAEAIELWAGTERLFMADDLTPRWKRQSLYALIVDCVERYHAHMQTRHLTATLELDDANRLTTDFDRDMMDIALSNLIDNACKYSFASRVIAVRARRESGFVTIAVEDYGHGIDEAAKDVIYEGWQRRAFDPKRAIAGAGLGLPLARAIAEAHGGTLTHTSRPARTRIDDAGATGEAAVKPHVVVFTLKIPTRRKGHEHS